MSVDDTTGSWIFVYVINNLSLTDSVRNEIRVDRVTFIKFRKFKRKSRQFGLGNYSELVERKGIHEFFDDLHETNTLAIIRISGALGVAGKSAEQIIGVELDVLAMSRLYSGSVRPLVGRTLGSGLQGRVQFIAVDSAGDSKILGMRRTPVREFVLDENWHAWQKDFYLNSLIKCLRKEYDFEKAWRATLLRAVSLVAEGMTSTNPSFSFLHNMIALETILLRQGDEHKVELPRRLQAFMGWSTDWATQNYEKKILQIYAKRCRYVHDGDISTISDADVEFTDHLLHNVFNNVLKHPSLFNGKDALIEFSNKVSAERLLGISPARSKYLPKTIGLTCKDYE